MCIYIYIYTLMCTHLIIPYYRHIVSYIIVTLTMYVCMNVCMYVHIYILYACVSDIYIYIYTHMHICVYA